MKLVITTALGFGALCGSAAAQDSSGALQIRAGTLLLADGQRVENGVLVVEDGRVRQAGADVDVDPRLPLIEHEGFVTPGLVLCRTFSGARNEFSDHARSLLPEARLLDAFAPEHPDFERALAAGITSVVLAPDGRNVAGGLTAVVKTAHGTVVEPEAQLALSFAREALGQAVQRSIFPFGSGDDAAVRDGGPEITDTSGRGQRHPTSYGGALLELRLRFAEPEGVFARAKSGELPVLLEAWDRHEVARAAGFAMEQGLRGAILGAPLAADPGLVGLLAESGLGVIVGPYALGQRRRSLEVLHALAEAGVPVAFALDAPDHDPAAVRLSAAMALGAGADRDAVWRALTLDAARLAGVEDRVGSLERGRQADFVLWSGDPLDLSSRVEAVYVDGRLAWPLADGGSR